MATRKQAAQAQALKSAEITQQESFELVRCLLRVSIYHVSYLRGLFPDSSFKGVDMQNLDSMHIKMLMRSDGDGEAKRLVDWVEGGVVDAIRKKYLKKLFFGIASDSAAKHLLEEYVFAFSYDDQGGVSMELGATAKGKHRSMHKQEGASQKPDVNSVKYQVVRLMRMLVSICQTLEKIPEERFLFMKLTYFDNAPEEYEPPFFEAARDRAVGTFTRKPFTMHVGQVGTDHHQVDLQVKSVLDAMDMVPDLQNQEPEADCLSNSQQVSTNELSDTAADQDEGEESMGGFSPGAAANKQPGRVTMQDLYTAPQDLPHGSDDAVSCMAPATCKPAHLQEVRAYVMRRSEVHLLDAMGYFAGMPAPVLEGCFKELVTDGVLARTADKEVFTVEKPAAPAPEHEVIRSMRTLAVDARQLGSEMGGMHDMPGSTATQSQTVGGKPQPQPKRKADIENSPPVENLWVDGTQCSDRGTAAQQKFSIVEDTIHQRGKRAKKAETGKRMQLRNRMSNMAR